MNDPEDKAEVSQKHDDDETSEEENSSGEEELNRTPIPMPVQLSRPSTPITCNLLPLVVTKQVPGGILLAIKSFENEKPAPKPLEITLICDRSGSMMGVKSKMVQGTIKALQELAPPFSTLAVITFNSTAQVHGLHRPLNEWKPEQLQNALIPRGRTNLYEGLSLGLSLHEINLRHQHEQESSTHSSSSPLLHKRLPVMLAFTDGICTSGKTKNDLIDWFQAEVNKIDPEMEIWICGLGNDADHALISAMTQNMRNTHVDFITDEDLSEFAAAVGKMINVWSEHQRICLETSSSTESKQWKRWKTFYLPHRETTIYRALSLEDNTVVLRVRINGEEIESAIDVNPSEFHQILFRLTLMEQKLNHIIMEEDSSSSAKPEQQKEIYEIKQELVHLNVATSRRFLMQINNIKKLLQTIKDLKALAPLPLLRCKSQSLQCYKSIQNALTRANGEHFRLRSISSLKESLLKESLLVK